MIVYNFLESYDLSGKTIVPFCTHGGSGLSGTERTIEEITGGNMSSGLKFPGQRLRMTAKGQEVRSGSGLMKADLLSKRL